MKNDTHRKCCHGMPQELDRDEFLSFCNEFPPYAWRNHPPLRSKGGGTLPGAGGKELGKLINSSKADHPLTPNVVPSTGAACDATSCAYKCGHDGEPCEVAELFKNTLLEELSRERGIPVTGQPMKTAPDGFTELVDAVSRELPCEWCRATEKAIARLSRVRLGKHERRILLVAPSNGKYETIEPDGESRSAAEANRRAMRELNSAGLLHLTWQGVEIPTRQYAYGAPVHRTYRKSAVRLSPLGAAVVDRLKETLQDAGRIRWADHQVELIAMVRKQPKELLGVFKARLAKALGPVSAFAGMVQCLNPEGARQQQGRARALATVLMAISRSENVERGEIHG